MLTRIEHLKTINQDLKGKYLHTVDSLRFKYMRMLEQRDEDVRYEVDIRNGKHRAAGVHASEAGGCLRALTYAIMGTERKSNGNNVNMLMRFAIGHAVHAMIQHDFKLLCEREEGITFESEVGIYPELGGAAAQWDIHSSCDGVFSFWDGEAESNGPYLRVGLEIKTESDKGFSKLHEPREKHREQTCVYMSCLDLPLMWVLYYNKSNSNLTGPHAPWLYQYNDKMWSQLEKRISKATSLSDLERTPKREESFECSWCPFAWVCNPTYLQRRQR